jgi:hypothetical protein
MLVLPFTKGMASTKLEFELLILHLWFRDTSPFKGYYLLNNVNLNHSLVERLEDSIFPRIAGLLLTEVVNHHEERSE